MSFFVVGDELAVLGFSLVGVEGQIVESAAEARQAFDDALAKEGVSVVLITEKWAETMREHVNELKMTSTEPLVLDIPGSEPAEQGPSLHELLEQALGMRIARETGV